MKYWEKSSVKAGVITAAGDFEGSEVDIIAHIERLVGDKMELKRDIYKKLLEWKQDDSGKVLQVSGARQVGKTHILNKFAAASRSIDCDYLNIKENDRFYFLDVGIAHYFVARAGADESIIRGIVAENFVYLTLLRHISGDIAGNAPWFATYGKTKGELDYIYYLKGDTYGGRTEDGKIQTVPLYLADRIAFNLGV